MKYYVYLIKNLKRIKKRVCKSNHVLRKKAMNSHNLYSTSPQSTMEQMIKILAYKYADDMLQALYQATICSLKALGSDAMMLIKWHAYEANRKQVAQEYGYSMRTMYRKTKALLQRFCNKMSMLGYDEDWFETQKQKLGFDS